MKNFLSIILILYALPQTQTMIQYEVRTDDTPKHQPFQVNGNFYCPAEGNDRDVLATLSKSNINASMTLIPKTSVPDQETLCMYEVEPNLDRRSDKERKILTWDVHNTYEIYYFHFRLWYNYFISPYFFYELMEENNQNHTIETIIQPIYNIIVHPFQEVVVATRHRISSTEYVSYYKDLQNQITNSTNDLSSRPFCLKATYILSILNAFQSYNSNPNPKMIKQKIVPEQHLAPLQNKATKHVINIAPLWDKLALLMAVIDYGIHRADAQIKRKFSQENSADPSNIHELVIYTRLVYPDRDSTSTDLYIPDIWCKFVHYKTKKLGVLIYIHNTPQQPPQEENKLCNIEDRIDCNFYNWIGNVIENIQYAYCCAPPVEIIENVFWLKDEIRGALDIEKIIKGNTDILDESMSKWEPEDSLMENDRTRKRQKVTTDAPTNKLQPDDSYIEDWDVTTGQQINLNHFSTHEMAKSNQSSNAVTVMS